MHAASHPVLGMTWSGFGALLIVVGAVLVIFDVNALIGSTWGGTRPEPRDRLLIAASKVGSISVAVGAVILATDAGLTALAVVVVLIVVAVGEGGPMRSRGQCLWHATWRPARSGTDGEE
jgi:hypothetical protein